MGLDIPTEEHSSGPGRKKCRNHAYPPDTGIHPGMTPRSITLPDLADLCRRTSTQILAWTFIAMVASVILQVIVG